MGIARTPRSGAPALERTARTLPPRENRLITTKDTKSRRTSACFQCDSFVCFVSFVVAKSSSLDLPSAIFKVGPFCPAGSTYRSSRLHLEVQGSACAEVHGTAVHPKLRSIVKKRFLTPFCASPFCASFSHSEMSPSARDARARQASRSTWGGTIRTDPSINRTLTVRS